MKIFGMKWLMELGVGKIGRKLTTVNNYLLKNEGESFSVVLLKMSGFLKTDFNQMTNVFRSVDVDLITKHF